jgi:hypothetical protein
MATSEQTQELLDALRTLKKECDNWDMDPKRQPYDYTSLKLTYYISRVDQIDASVLSSMVVTDLLHWIYVAIDALKTPLVTDDIPALNIIIGKLAFQFP